MARRPSVFARFRVAGVLIVAGVGLAGALFYAMINSHYLGAIIGRTLGPYSDTLARYAFENPDGETLSGMARVHDVSIVFRAPDGEVMAFDSDGEPAPPESLGHGGQIRATREAPDGSRITLYWRLWTVWHGHAPAVMGLLVMVAAVVGSALWFLRRHLQPLAGLHDGVEAVARGDFETQVPVVRNDEIGRVAEAFNEMTGRVGAMIDDRERLLADVSHELRSPLARIKVALELLPAGDKRDGIARDVREMEQLIAALLEREALRSRAGRLEPERVDLSELLREAVEKCGDRPPGVRIEAAPGVTLDGDRALLRMLIQNLLDNALKFSRAESAPVAVRVEDEAERVVLRVLDDGVGIPPGEEQRVLEPFVKIDPARGHRSGHGLGLNLCDRIVSLHRGTIRLARRAPRGTEVVVELPREAG